MQARQDNGYSKTFQTFRQRTTRYIMYLFPGAAASIPEYFIPKLSTPLVLSKKISYPLLRCSLPLVLLPPLRCPIPRAAAAGAFLASPFFRRCCRFRRRSKSPKGKKRACNGRRKTNQQIRLAISQKREQWDLCVIVQQKNQTCWHQKSAAAAAGHGGVHRRTLDLPLPLIFPIVDEGGRAAAAVSLLVL